MPTRAEAIDVQTNSVILVRRTGTPVLRAAFWSPPTA